MAIAKRATNKLREAGLDNFIVNKGLYGFSVRDTRLKDQRSIIYETAKEAIDMAIKAQALKI